ncbi:IS3 family transposase [Paenarthrobacter nitroguajacolicus]|uniref:IS3 family transposase n=2 Tax=Paenarthrobacter nitroguajacolicus TaxID=211146 RepID=UPI0015BCD9B3|nr:IS3 family transposase [Paenarthrobacter nitroguajacolicus]NWL31652.1 IS3 family transposase [Paenarthrobacter nitroguajacolicus]NWL32641.1 IS3 family transposase [Paenarthrobacter nitroguajacolicus]NWL32695.1 IS3 family transposase [Paenarthrobacter nitroguajacolicus]
MPTAYGAEFRQDVIDVARKGEAPLAQIAKDFGLSVTTLKRWIAIAERKDSGAGPAVSESAEVRELKKRNRLLEQENEILRRAAAYLARDINPKMTYPLVTDLAADGVPVAVTCRVLKFSKQGYYRWRVSPVTERDWVDAHLVNAAFDIHADDPAFGYRFIADELSEKGIAASENRVQRLCSDHGIWSVFSKKRGLNRRPGPPVHDDLVERDFTAAAPNELWLTDITEHPTAEGKLYLCAVKDVYSGRIVGYSMDLRMKSSLAVAALENAVRARKPAGTVVHSDRGSQFRSRRFVESLRRQGLTGSMGRVGACADNAAMESFFSLLQKNVLDRQRWLTRQDLRLAITTWIERTYHRRRRQRRLGKLTPIEYETINRTALTAA